MPLLVSDPRGVLTRAPERARTQLTSSVDVAPLLLTIASGSDAWRRETRYSHIAERLDLARILPTRRLPGAPRAARDRRDPDRVRDRALRGRRAAARRRDAHAEAKYATYSNWRPETIELLERDRNASSTTTAPTPGAWSCTTAPDRARSRRSCTRELRAPSPRSCASPLPPHLNAAHARGFRRLLLDRQAAAATAAARRKLRSEREAGPGERPPGRTVRGPALSS